MTGRYLGIDSQLGALLGWVIELVEMLDELDALVVTAAHVRLVGNIQIQNAQSLNRERGKKKETKKTP